MWHYWHPGDRLPDFDLISRESIEFYAWEGTWEPISELVKPPYWSSGSHRHYRYTLKKESKMITNICQNDLNNLEAGDIITLKPFIVKRHVNKANGTIEIEEAPGGLRYINSKNVVAIEKAPEKVTRRSINERLDLIEKTLEGLAKEIKRLV